MKKKTMNNNLNQYSPTDNTYSITHDNSIYTFNKIDYSRELYLNDFLPISIVPIVDNLQFDIDIESDHVKKTDDVAQNDQPKTSNHINNNKRKNNDKTEDNRKKKKHDFEKMTAEEIKNLRKKIAVSDGFEEIEEEGLIRLFAKYYEKENNVLQIGGGSKKFEVIQTKDNRNHFKKIEYHRE
jgi:hypothetical protein